MDLLYSKGGLKKGFSTGTVSAGAIKSSIRYYFSARKFEIISVDMPGGELVNIDVADLSRRFLKNGTEISTAVIQKFSGDDADVTDGIKIYADFMIINQQNEYKYVKKSQNINYSNNVNNDNISNVNDNVNDNDNCKKNNYNSLKSLGGYKYDNGSNNVFDKINAENIKNDLKNYFNEFHHKKLFFYDIIENVKNQIIQGAGFNLFADNAYFLFSSADGIGVATKQGLPVNIGSPAINPVPLDMIKKNALNELKNIILNDGYYGYIRNSLKSDTGNNANDVNDVKFFLSILYIPDGEEVSKKTLNSRLGIAGGLSILGTTGYVIPISAKAWLDTIKSSLLFLYKNNIDVCVFTPGRFSEKCAMKIFKNFSEEYFIEIGDFVIINRRVIIIK